MDILLETIRALLILVILLSLYRAGRRRNMRQAAYWRYILLGFLLIFLGALIDITDNFPFLDRYVFIGDTVAGDILGKAVGYLLGFFLLALGLTRWLSNLAMHDVAEREPTEARDGLDLKVEARAMDIAQSNESLSVEIAQRQKAEDALRMGEKFLSDVLDSVQDGVSILDREFNIVRVNSAMKRWYSHRMPIVGKKCHAAYHGTDRMCEPCPSLRTLKEKKTAMDVVPYDAPDGSKGWLELYTFPFFEDDSGEPSGVIEFVRDITPRRQAEDQIKRSLEEKEVLLKEVHHRVKNNMAIMKSLLNIQSRSVESQLVREALIDSQSRINAMALVHEKLYKGENLSSIRFVDYVQDLANYLIDVYRSGTARPVLVMDIGDEVLGLDMLIPCGLILNELVTNSIKHAFRDTERPMISIAYKPEGDNRYSLVYADNGSGIPEGIGMKNASSFGLQIIKLLARQLGGDIRMDANGGARFTITFAIEDVPGKMEQP